MLQSDKLYGLFAKVSFRNPPPPSPCPVTLFCSVILMSLSSRLCWLYTRNSRTSSCRDDYCGVFHTVGGVHGVHRVGVNLWIHQGCIVNLARRDGVLGKLAGVKK